MKNGLMVMTFLFSLNALAIDCHGTEPFWRASVSEDKVILDQAGDIPILTLPINKVSGAAGFTSGFLKVYANNNGPVAVVTSNKCNNSMSDDIFPNEIILFTGATTLYGCCGQGVVTEPNN